MMYRSAPHLRGFTLIELAIVLVIIGLIVGGVLAGQSLIAAAAIRAQITQIDKFNAAANTFRDKYGALPGDLGAVSAATFGLTTRTGNPGEGDNNGVIEGTYTWNPSAAGTTQGQGETALFWIDLTWANGQTVNLVEGNFMTNALGGATWSGAQLDKWFPHTPITGNFVYVYSSNSTNYYGISIIKSMGSTGGVTSVPGITVSQANMIDQKIDDGLPQTGRVIAQYIKNSSLSWAAGQGANGASGTASTPSSATTCYDNGSVAGAVQQYSVEVGGGSNINCALSFRMQAGD